MLFITNSMQLDQINEIFKNLKYFDLNWREK